MNAMSSQSNNTIKIYIIIKIALTYQTGRVRLFQSPTNLRENRYIRRGICPQNPANLSSDIRWFSNISLKEGNVKTSTSAITLMKYEMFSNFRLSSFLSWY
jgi:hypothetical protein